MRHSIWTSWLTFLLTLIITGCASVTKPPSATVETPEQKASWKTRELALKQIQSWQVAGKIAVQTERDSGSASVNWIQNHNQYAVSLFGPLGSGSLKLIGRPGNVTLETPDGKRYTATSAEQLLAKQWGWNLPVSYITYWIRGLPVPNIPADSQFDSDNRLASLVQKDWKVEFLSYTQSGNVDLPQKISISSPSLKSKIVIHRWKIGA